MDYGKIYLILQTLHLSLNVPGTENIRARAMEDLMKFNALPQDKVEIEMEVEEKERRI